VNSSGRSSEKTAEALGTSRGKVEKARTVLKNADDELLDEVKSGEKSINQAYNEVVEKKQAKTTKEQPLFEEEQHEVAHKVEVSYEKPKSDESKIDFDLTKNQSIDDYLYFEFEKSAGEIRISKSSEHGSLTIVAISSKAFEEEALKEFVVTTIAYLQWQIKRGGL
jgi:ParB-like chromosome segregation protein Spo0J